MEITIALLPGPLENHPTLRSAPTDQDGAVVEFKGLVRRDEAGASIAALEYEAYQSMAEAMIRQIVEALGGLHPCGSVVVLHRLGIVPVGEAAIIVRAASRHRAEAFALVSDFMDRLKQDVPIWKVRALSPAEVATSVEK